MNIKNYYNGTNNTMTYWVVDGRVYFNEEEARKAHEDYVEMLKEER